MTKWITTLLLLTASVFSTAQEATQPEMADVMRDNGKIYVVVAVLAVIFVGIVIFLTYLERKLRKLEKEVKG